MPGLPTFDSRTVVCVCGEKNPLGPRPDHLQPPPAPQRSASPEPSLVFKCGQMPLWRQCRVTGFSVTKHIRRVATLHPNSGFSFTPNPGIHRISRAVGPGVQLLLFACLMLNHRPLCFWEIVCLHPLPAAVTSSQSVTAAHPWLSLTLLQPPAWDISPDPGLPCLPMPLCRLLWL